MSHDRSSADIVFSRLKGRGHVGEYYLRIVRCRVSVSKFELECGSRNVRGIVIIRRKQEKSWREQELKSVRESDEHGGGGQRPRAKGGGTTHLACSGHGARVPKHAFSTFPGSRATRATATTDMVLDPLEGPCHQ